MDKKIIVETSGNIYQKILERHKNENTLVKIHDSILKEINDDQDDKTLLTIIVYLQGFIRDIISETLVELLADDKVLH